jgi:RNA polymerase sigma-70 factor, ECF subfamily
MRATTEQTEVLADNGAEMTAEAAHELRPLMFSIAYRMVGSVSEAEDVVQEAFVRLERATEDGVVVRSPKAYLATATTRLAIDHLRSARVRRETYVGTWLPEPLIADNRQDPERNALMSDSLSMAFLVLLESLSPVERAVFLLREVFDYGYDEIAEIVDRSEPNCRQILVRARRRIDEGRPRFEASRAESEEMVRRFLAVTESGDLDELVDLLATDVAFYGDGGGKATAVREPLLGRERVAPFLLGLRRQGSRLSVALEPAVVNGQAGLVTRDAEGQVISVLAFEVAEDQIQAIRAVVNPDKLEHLGPVSDVARRRQPPEEMP